MGSEAILVCVTPEDIRLPSHVRKNIKVEDIPRHNAAERHCWTWAGCKTPKGYGVTWHKGKTQFAHRLIYLLIIGEIAKGLQVDHLCRNRSCCNPAHLEIVTLQENIRRGMQGILRTHCINGHLFTNGSYYESKCRGYTKRDCKECVSIRNQKTSQKRSAVRLERRLR